MRKASQYTKVKVRLGVVIDFTHLLNGNKKHPVLSFDDSASLLIDSVNQGQRIFEIQFTSISQKR